ncbi:MAG: hypothetical protein JST19_00795 [Bacteroidetes bacterium]|nr:hypothetical protein [Bacteroidota bacterium]
MKYYHMIAVMRFAAISGNILFALWVTYNAVNERFHGTPMQIASYIGLIGLFTINTILVLKRPD